LVEKELEEAHYDLKSAEKSVKEENYKWAIVQSYYSIFHAFRGLLFSRGYREKSHICLKFAIEILFVENGLISEELLDDFDFAMKTRERADYSYIYDESLAHDMVESNKNLIDEVENLLYQT
jgi:uncharacterized protein (UPF0332 family)